MATGYIEHKNQPLESFVAAMHRRLSSYPVQTSTTPWTSAIRARNVAPPPPLIHLLLLLLLLLLLRDVVARRFPLLE